MYANGQKLVQYGHFSDHIGQDIPVQIYMTALATATIGQLPAHADIGFVQEVTALYVKVNNSFFHRGRFRFVSRPGY